MSLTRGFGCSAIYIIDWAQWVIITINPDTSSIVPNWTLIKHIACTQSQWDAFAKKNHFHWYSNRSSSFIPTFVPTQKLKFNPFHVFRQIQNESIRMLSIQIDTKNLGLLPS